MIQEIKNNIDQPELLEQLYRSDKSAFTKSFDAIFPSISEHPIANTWHQRLHFKQSEISWGSRNEIYIVLALALFAGLIAKLGFFLGIDPDLYFPRNISFVAFPAIAIYFAWKTQLSTSKSIILALVFVSAAIYINLLPDEQGRDTITLAFIHLPLLLWALTGYVFTGGKFENLTARIDFLRFNGDLLVLGTVIFISGMLLSAITIGLFELINLSIAEFYFEKIAIWGGAAIPVIATFLVRSNPQLVKNVSPIIAKVFTPLVLCMLVIYLAAMIYTGKDPYNDREFLLIFNVLLLGVMALILFSVVESSRSTTAQFNTWMLFLLSVVTIIINGIALSAIIFRISEWGLTPNRLAVLGGNILILIHLVLVTHQLFNALRDGRKISDVELKIAVFLPIYTAWTVLVVFFFPILFDFK